LKHCVIDLRDDVDTHASILQKPGCHGIKQEQKWNIPSRGLRCCMPGIVQFPRKKAVQADATGLTGGSPVALLPVALSEVFAGVAADAGAVGFVLSRLARGPAPILWIQDRLSRRETGVPYLPGLGPGRPILLVDVARPTDVLIAAEEGLRCKSLSAVIAEIHGNAPALDFTATKRLALRAEAAGVPCWLIRHGGSADLSAARDRWRITSLPAGPNPDDGTSPGDPRWRVELFRSRDKPPGLWVARHDRAADRIDFLAAVPDGTLAESGGTGGQRTAP
jgi:protein ImuA